VHVRENRGNGSQLEMDSDNDIPVPPDLLHPIAVECWNNFWRHVDHETIKPSFHGNIVAAYCAEYAIWCQACVSVNKLGLIVRTGNKTKIHPLLKVRDRAAKNMIRIGRKIGLEPGIAIKAISERKLWRQWALTVFANSLDGVEEVLVDDDSGEGNGSAETSGSNPQR